MSAHVPAKWTPFRRQEHAQKTTRVAGPVLEGRHAEHATQAVRLDAIRSGSRVHVLPRLDDASPPAGAAARRRRQETRGHRQMEAGEVDAVAVDQVTRARA